ncbi:type IV pilus twitching motility protein PilT [Legionella rowbothamii]|uniref:type IV pilus twitching motility protein PilT n=1 Tax=Legionella rowbothamii TaxID=96229 RepID=UPI0010560C0E|nr:type IV pilus twitching motility protein PilT [Legionella rowbothamii]
MDITELLTWAVNNHASDLHLSSGMEPRIRVDGELRKMNLPVLEHLDLFAMIHELLSTQQKEELAKHLQLDFSFEIAALGRFRVNVFHHLRGIGAVFRLIPTMIPSFCDLNLPPVFNELINYSHGLVLVTGPTGSGKSTTLAAMIDGINLSRHGHILTIEDPIEFVHPSNKCLVNQREVHNNVPSFQAALRSALREDPDVLLVGELRDLETIRLAMSAAETGHLVLGTLHTNSAVHAVNRIIDVFPGEEKTMARSILAESLRAVIAQRLVRRKEGRGRIAALEIMICTGAIRNLIREDKVAQMVSFLQTGQAIGMQTLDQHLLKLVMNESISKDIALEVAVDKALF